MLPPIRRWHRGYFGRRRLVHPHAALQPRIFELLHHVDIVRGSMMQLVPWLEVDVRIVAVAGRREFGQRDDDPLLAPLNFVG